MIKNLQIFLVLLLALSSLTETSANCIHEAGTLKEPITPSVFESYINGKNKTGTHLTLDEVIHCLPDNYLSNFTMIYESRSLERADVSPEYPRIILFGKTASPTFAFTGKPESHGGIHYNKLQMIAPQDLEDHVYRDYEFGPNEARKKPVIRDEVTGKCKSCHLHMIWDPYEDWEGAYGSVDDLITHKQEYYKHEKTQKEAVLLEKFKSTTGKEGRYSSLHYGLHWFSPYSDKSKPDSLDNRPNARFTLGASYANVRRLVGKVIKADHSIKNHLKNLYHLFRCEKKYPNPLFRLFTKYRIQATELPLQFKVREGDEKSPTGFRNRTHFDFGFGEIEGLFNQEYFKETSKLSNSPLLSALIEKRDKDKPLFTDLRSSYARLYPWSINQVDDPEACEVIAKTLKSL